MKLKKSDVALFVGYVLLIVLLLVLNFVKFTFSEDTTTNELIKNCLIRAVAGAFAVTVCVAFGYKRILNPLVLNDKKALLWCFPCLLVILANFPFSALISGMATVNRTDLLWLFALNCLLIGIFEEVLFRGVFQTVIAGAFKEKPYAAFKTIAATSALFGAWHLTNLLGGAAIGPTILQVGYSFLIGAMLSAVLMRTGNLWSCILLHASFDFGGLLIDTLGSGVFQDTCFWILTIVCGALCFFHIFFYLLRTERSRS